MTREEWNKIKETRRTYKKYELTDETITVEGIILHRIRALNDFGDVKAGDIGGYVESMDNLSTSAFGTAWIYENAMVYGNAKIWGDAKVYGNARVFGKANVFGNATVYGNARVFGEAAISGNAEIFENSEVSDNARVGNHAKIFGNAKACEYAYIFYDIMVHGDAIVKGSVPTHTDVYGYRKRRRIPKTEWNKI